MNKSTRSRVMRSRVVCASLAIWLVAGQCLAVVQAPELADPGRTRMSPDQQKQLGLQVAGQVYAQMPVLPDNSPETRYIQALGKRLFTTIPPARSWPFQFHVIPQKEINAFALPGGPMFINIGTITAAANEAELAGVMAHEMAHIYMQHSAKQQEKGSLLEGLAGLAGAVAGAAGGVVGTLARAGIQLGAGTLMLKYSRADESQADAVGAIILWKVGFNPMAMSDFFQKLEAKGGSGPQFLSDHPNPGNRRAAIQRQVNEWPARRYSGNSSEFARVRQHAAGVRAYSAQEIAAGAKNGQWAAENRRNGMPVPSAVAAAKGSTAGVASVSVTDVQPSSYFRVADLGALRIERPDNWNVLGGGSQESSVTIAPLAGISGAEVAYGVVIRAGRAPAVNMSSRQLAAEIIRSLQGSDANMRQIGDIQPVSVGGMAGASVMLETISPVAGANGRPQRERDWLVAVPRGADAVFLVFVSAEAHFDQFRPTFERMLRSARFP